MQAVIVGGGKMGLSHLGLLTHYVGKYNVALLDNNLFTRLFFRFLGYKTYSSLNQIDIHKRKTCLIIATPTSTHYKFVEWAIHNKIACFVEKPLTLSPDLSLNLIKLSASNDCYVQVGFVMRYVSSFQKLRNIVSKNYFGKVVSYHASLRGNVISKEPDNKNWQGDFKRGGGCLNEYGPHIIDLCIFIFGEVDDICTAHKKHVFSTNADDQISLNWTHQNGLPGHVDINWSDPSKRKSVLNFDIKFEFAELRVDNSHIEVLWHDSTTKKNLCTPHIDLSSTTAEVNFYLRGEEFSLEIEDFLEHCLRKKIMKKDSISKDTTPLLRSGYEVDRLIDVIAKKVGLK
jgi:predicted dehydrogenase